MDAESAFNAARRSMGPESALNRVKSLHFEGYVVAEDSGSRAKLEIVFAKPHLSWMKVSRENIVENMVANKFEGFMRKHDLSNGDTKTSVLPARVASRMNNLAWMNLHFFAHPQKRFGKAKSQGFVKVDGRLCHKVRLQFPSDLWTDLYFDKESGSPLASQDDNGLRRVLSGQIVSGGIRFPKEITIFEPGKETRRLVFEKIAVNQAVDPRIFEFPTDS
ncbi:MAG: hypothetical protein ACPGN3_00745 [Opitutales bacterium]